MFTALQTFYDWITTQHLQCLDYKFFKYYINTMLTYNNEINYYFIYKFLYEINTFMAFGQQVRK